MFTNFESVINYIKDTGIKKTAAVAAAQDDDVLSSAVKAKSLGILDFVFVGDKEKISVILNDLGETPDNWEIINEKNDTKAAEIVARMVQEKKVDMPIKGLLHTSVFLKALLNKERKLLSERSLLSQVETIENPISKRLLLVTDGVINVAPDYNDKIKIINNAVLLANKLGIQNPKVAVLAAVETVNPDMPECIEAAMLSKANEHGQIKGCIIDGPLSLDLALSEDAAKTKGLTGEVVGKADILLAPNIVTGNVLIKSLRLAAESQVAGSILGAKIPFIATSRSDNMDNKLNTIALSILQLASV